MGSHSPTIGALDCPCTGAGGTELNSVHVGGTQIDVIPGHEGGDYLCIRKFRLLFNKFFFLYTHLGLNGWPKIGTTGVTIRVAMELYRWTMEAISMYTSGESSVISMYTSAKWCDHYHSLYLIVNLHYENDPLH